MSTRTFSLRLPQRFGGSTAPVLSIDAPASLLLPKRLEKHGLVTYEPETLACFLAAVEVAGPGEVFDIGSNVGVFSWLAAGVGERKVKAFEPAPEVAATAGRIARTNNLGIDVENMAISDESGRATFYISSTSDMSSSLKKGFRVARDVIDVAMSTVDAYCEENELSPAVLKIDTESTEPAVLRGALGLIERRRPFIFCEVLGGGKTENELAEILGPFDYHWFQITTEIPLVPRKEIFGDRGGVFRNWLFTPDPLSKRYWRRVRHYRNELAACGAILPRSWADDVSDISPRLGRVAAWANRRLRRFKA